MFRYYLFIIGIQPVGRFGQRPELSQSTGIALVRCILGKFLGVVCHCFPPPLDVPTFATRCLDARDPSGGRWNCGQECCPVFSPFRKHKIQNHTCKFHLGLDRYLSLLLYNTYNKILLINAWCTHQE